MTITFVPAVSDIAPLQLFSGTKRSPTGQAIILIPNLVQGYLAGSFVVNRRQVHGEKAEEEILATEVNEEREHSESS